MGKQQGEFSAQTLGAELTRNERGDWVDPNWNKKGLFISGHIASTEEALSFVIRGLEELKTFPVATKSAPLPCKMDIAGKKNRTPWIDHYSYPGKRLGGCHFVVSCYA